MWHNKAFSLIELLLFIVVLSIAFVSVTLFSQTLFRSHPVLSNIDTALIRAQSRAELLLQQKRLYGMNFNDVCPQTELSTLCQYTQVTPAPPFPSNVTEQVVQITGFSDDHKTTAKMTLLLGRVE